MPDPQVSGQSDAPKSTKTGEFAVGKVTFEGEIYTDACEFGAFSS